MAYNGSPMSKARATADNAFDMARGGRLLEAAEQLRRAAQMLTDYHMGRAAAAERQRVGSTTPVYYTEPQRPGINGKVRKGHARHGYED